MAKLCFMLYEKRRELMLSVRAFDPDAPILALSARPILA